MTETLVVTVEYAKGLRDADWIPMAGKSDPYCILGLRGKDHTRSETKAISNTCDPEWNQTLEIGDYVPGDVLEISVWDKDPGKPDDLLGEGILYLASFNGTFDGGVVLSQTGAFVRLQVAAAAPPPASTFISEPIAYATPAFTVPAEVSPESGPYVVEAMPTNPDESSAAVVASDVAESPAYVADATDAVYVSPDVATTAVTGGETVVETKASGSEGKKKKEKKKKVAEVTKRRKMFCCF